MARKIPCLATYDPNLATILLPQTEDYETSTWSDYSHNENGSYADTARGREQSADFSSDGSSGVDETSDHSVNGVQNNFGRRSETNVSSSGSYSPTSSESSSDWSYEAEQWSNGSRSKYSNENSWESGGGGSSGDSSAGSGGGVHPGSLTIVGAFVSGLGTGAKAVANAASTSVANLGTLGGLLADPAEIAPQFEFSDYERAIGAETSQAIAGVSTEIAIGLATGGASRLGAAGRAVTYVDQASNLGAGVVALDDIAENGLNLQNGLGALSAAAGAGSARSANEAFDSAAAARARGNAEIGSLTIQPGGACFTADTPVATPDGSRAIRELRAGDAVLAFDHVSGAWSSRTVTALHENLYENALVTVTTDRGAFRATVHHPVWVVAGRELIERPICTELSPGENEGETLAGRWVNSHDLRPGDVLIDRTGAQRTVTRIEQEFVSCEPVFNLTVEGLHTYAVGETGLLVHNACAKPQGGNPPTVESADAPKTLLPDRVTKELPEGEIRTAAETKQARNFFERNRQTARDRWSERNDGRDYPSNTTHDEHPRPLADGGDPLHIEPGYDGPNAPHMIPGPDGLTDFQRWGQRGGRPRSN